MSNCNCNLTLARLDSDEADYTSAQQPAKQWIGVLTACLASAYGEVVAGSLVQVLAIRTN